MEITELCLPGVKLIRPRVFADNRGYVFESYSKRRYEEQVFEDGFVQDNHAHSVAGTLRGLHYRASSPQSKLVRVVSGRIFDVTVDIRPDSPTFGRWEGVYLDAGENLQLFIPEGFAHGFCVVSEEADVLYKLSDYYDPQLECGLRWNDPELGIEWPVANPILSERDRGLASFAEYRRGISR